MRWSSALAGLLLAAVLAGCLASGGGGDAGEAQAPEAQAPAADAAGGEVLRAPNWSVGDHWTYASEGLDEDVVWVVTGETRDAWVVDTTHRGVAFIDARNDISFFGQRRKADLAGSQGDDRVEYFRWPLEEGKTWSTTWDGVQRTVTVESIQDGAAVLVATQEGRLAVEYTYDASAGHFGRFAFFDENGTKVNGAELKRSGSGFEGTAVRWRLATAADLEGSFGAEPASEGFGFEVPEGATDLWLDLSIRCPGAGGYDFGLGGNGSGYSERGNCPAEVDITGPVIEEPDPGSYRGGIAASSPAGEGSYDALLLVRTLEEVEVGEGEPRGASQGG